MKVKVPVAVYSRVVERDGKWWFEAVFEGGEPLAEPQPFNTEKEAHLCHAIFRMRAIQARGNA